MHDVNTIMFYYSCLQFTDNYFVWPLSIKILMKLVPSTSFETDNIMLIYQHKGIEGI